MRRTFAIELVRPKCQNQLRLIAITKTEAVINKILVAMHLPAEAPELHPHPHRPVHTAGWMAKRGPGTTGSTDGDLSETVMG